MCTCTISDVFLIEDPTPETKRVSSRNSIKVLATRLLSIKVEKLPPSNADALFAAQLLKSFQYLCGNLVHIQCLERGKRTFHTFQLNDWFVYTRDENHKVSLPRLLLVN